MTNKSTHHEGGGSLPEWLPIISREVQYDESIKKLGNLATIYGFEPHSPMTFDLLSLHEVRALGPHRTERLVESVREVVRQISAESQQADLPVGKPLFWKRNRRKHMSIGVFNTSQTFDERKRILGVIQEVSCIGQLPDVFQEYQPKVNVAYTRNSIAQPPEKIVTHFSRVLPSVITVSEIN